MTDTRTATLADDGSLTLRVPGRPRFYLDPAEVDAVRAALAPPEDLVREAVAAVRRLTEAFRALRVPTTAQDAPAVVNVEFDRRDQTATLQVTSDGATMRPLHLDASHVAFIARSLAMGPLRCQVSSAGRPCQQTQGHAGPCTFAPADRPDSLAADLDERDAQMRRQGALAVLDELAQCVNIDPRALDPWWTRFGGDDVAEDLADGALRPGVRETAAALLAGRKAGALAALDELARITGGHSAFSAQLRARITRGEWQ